MVKYVNTPFNTPETYSIPKGTKPVPKYLEIIYDKNDNRPYPYEIPLPPLENGEVLGMPSIEQYMNNNFPADVDPSNFNALNSLKYRTISSASTVSETSVYHPPVTRGLPRSQSDSNDLANSSIVLSLESSHSKQNSTGVEKLLVPIHTHGSKKPKLQMFTNTNLDSAAHTCDGITSM